MIKFAGYVLHVGRLVAGTLTVGHEVSCAVDYARRGLIAPNHTMTHMLNFALRKVLGQECDQKGSDNDTKRARFDFECVEGARRGGCGGGGGGSSPNNNNHHTNHNNKREPKPKNSGENRIRKPRTTRKATSTKREK